MKLMNERNLRGLGANGPQNTHTEECGANMNSDFFKVDARN